MFKQNDNTIDEEINLTYKKCQKCELNYVVDNQETCSSCQFTYSTKSLSYDDNKYLVEHDLLPILQSLPLKVIQSFTKKNESFNFLHLRLPLLVECNGYEAEDCKKEIKDATGHNRYYAKPYNIYGKKYHICSQWWSAAGNDSKEFLNILKLLNK